MVPQSARVVAERFDPALLRDNPGRVLGHLEHAINTTHDPGELRDLIWWVFLASAAARKVSFGIWYRHVRDGMVVNTDSGETIVSQTNMQRLKWAERLNRAPEYWRWHILCWLVRLNRLPA